MEYIIFIDNDGTLMNDDNNISKRAKKIIKKVIKKNIYVILCTGRPRYKAIETSKELGISNYIISSNGAEIYDYINEKVIYTNEINKSYCRKLFNMVIENNARILLNVDNYEYVNREIRNENQLIIEDDIEVFLSKYKVKQCHISGNNLENISKLRDRINSIDKNSVKIVNESSYFNTNKKADYDEIWFSVTNNTTSKGNAIKIISKYLNIPLERTIAIGNDYNDISMFEVVGKSIAMSNACDELKKIADIITESNNKDGVAIILEKLYKELKKNIL